MQTDRASYLLAEGPFGPETTIVTTFTAPNDRAVSLDNCNGAISVGLQKLVNDQWEHAWAVEMNACASAPIVLPAGGRRTETLVVASGTDAAVLPRRTETKIDAGTYRVVWQAVREVPLEQRVSAPFTIAIAPPRTPEKPAEIAGIAPDPASEAVPSAPVRVRFIAPKEARLYVDMHDVTGDAIRTGIELEYRPPRGWPAGQHDVRVVFGRQWYAWSFTVGNRPLDAADAKRLVGLLAAAINQLDHHLLHGHDALRAALHQ